jgi:competence protein ComEC
MEILAFALGMIFFYTKSCLPVLLILFSHGLHRCWRALIAFAVACAVGVCHQMWMADVGMPNRAVIPGATLQGEVASIPQQTSEKVQFVFLAYQLNHQPIRARLLLSCYQHCPILHAGERWQMRAKLRTIHNLNNPGGFDYKTFLEAQHIHWRGYTASNSFHVLAAPKHAFNLLALRERLAHGLTHLGADREQVGILSALTLGVTSSMTQELWALFRRTGTTHLMVISGAHIGLVAGMIFQLIRQIWSYIPYLCLRYPAQKAAGVVAIMVGFFYAMLAGFGVPAERSAVASFFIFFRYLGHKKLGSWQAWRYALFIVLLTEPHAVLMPGFYLSFMAVAILLIMNQRIRVQGWRKGVLIQVFCLLGLLPLTLFWFSYGAFDGFFANLVAIPWVSFIVVPLALLTLLLGHQVPWIVGLSKSAINGLLYYLHWVDAWFGQWNLTLSYGSIILPLVLMLALALRVLLPIRSVLGIALSMLAMALYPKVNPVKLGDFQVAIMDVGQGLACVVRTKSHTLIYDTGGKVYHGPDMSTLALLPYVHTIGLKHLDMIVISHPDLDHRGGLPTLETQYPPDFLVVDNPRFYHRGFDCHDYPDWHWEGVDFHFFSIPTIHNHTNNRSCVLKISNASGEILLTGDIESEAEHYLVKTYGRALQARVLVVPHHGSKTSSTLGFLRQVSPDYAVMSYGFDNRYRFPHPQTLENYRLQGVRVYHTAEQGMIQLDFSSQNVRITPFLASTEKIN